MATTEQLSQAVEHFLDRLHPVAEKAKAIIKSATRFCGALALTIMGAALSVFAASQVRLPDAALLQMAQQELAQQARMASASGERDFFLMMIGAGVVFLICGLHLIREWVRPFEERLSRRR